MSGCFFSVLLQKTKINIQNDVIVHQSASLSVNEDVRIYFKQSNRCSNALKCQKWAIKKILMLTPGPLVQQKVDRTFFKSKGRRRPFFTSSIERFQVKFSSQKAVVVVIMSKELIKCSLQDRSFHLFTLILWESTFSSQKVTKVQAYVLMKTSGSILNSQSVKNGQLKRKF